MSALWYYSSNGKQMDPVPMSELQRLAAKGSLKPADLVWKDGMANWVKASTVKGLFGDADAKSSAFVSAKAGAAAVPTKAKSAVATRDDDENDRPRRSKRRDEDEDDDDRPRRRRKPKDESGGLGMKIALIGGGSVLSLIVVIVLIVVLVRSSRPNQPAIAFNNVANQGNPVPAAQPGAIEMLKFSVDMRDGQNETRTVQLKGGHSYEGHLRSDGPSDVDIFIRNPNGQEIASDDTIGPNGYVRFFAPADGQYTILVDNLGPGRNRANVLISQLPGAAVAVAPPQVNPPGFPQPPVNPPGFPQPPIIKPPVFNPPVINPPGIGGNRINIGRLMPQRRFTTNREFPAGQMVRIRVQSAAIGNTDVDLFVRQNGNVVAADQGLSAQCFVQFMSQGGNCEIEVANLGPGSATCTLIFE